MLVLLVLLVLLRRVVVYGQGQIMEKERYGTDAADATDAVYAVYAVERGRRRGRRGRRGKQTITGHLLSPLSPPL